MPNRIETTFAALRAAGRKALMPFITAGDPDLATTAALVDELPRRGASVIELGLPYSDPVADGPTIQASYSRALAAGLRLDQIFEMVRQARARSEVPIAAMGSFTLVVRRGVAKFLDDARAAGIDGVIIPDLPLEECDAVAAEAARRGLANIMLVAPTTPDDRAAEIVRRSTGFVYCVSVTGITGERRDLPRELAARVAKLRAATRVPVCVGFGISRPEHVRLVAGLADGVIVGSAIVRRMEELSGRPRGELVAAVGAYVGELASALLNQ